MERADELQTQLDLLLQQNADCEEKMSTLANEIDQMKTANRDLENRLNTTEEMKSSERLINCLTALRPCVS
jgi:septal ring factor EnvC (AmiA/AmiB activator)